MMDALFQSYNANISLASFESLSSCTINWLEQYCKPQVIPLAPHLTSIGCELSFFLYLDTEGIADTAVAHGTVGIDTSHVHIDTIITTLNMT